MESKTDLTELEQARREIELLRGIIADGLGSNKGKARKERKDTPDAISEAKRKMINHLEHNGEITEGILRNKIRSISKASFDLAIAEMLKDGLVTSRDYLTIKNRRIVAYKLK